VNLDSQSCTSHSSRPVVYEYHKPADFFRDLLGFYKARGDFSLRARTAQVGLCSQGLVSQILNGKRQLNRDNLQALGLVFKLTQLELTYLDQCLSAQIWKSAPYETHAPRPLIRKPKNHILSDWLNPYVKDLVNLKGFSLDSERLFFMLQGIAPAQRIKKSVDFLFREGFWRRDLLGKIVLEEAAVITTNGIPNEKIRGFHIKALEIALKGIKAFPVSERKASTVLMSIDDQHMDELRGIMDSFQERLLEFIEKYPNGRDRLVQITMHLTPTGRSQ